MTPAAERRPLLPFGYARAHNVMLLSNGESCEVFCLAATAPQALLEARRVAGMPFSLERLEAEAFEKLLVLSYQRDSAEARRQEEGAARGHGAFSTATAADTAAGAGGAVAVPRWSVRR